MNKSIFNFSTNFDLKKDNLLFKYSAIRVELINLDIEYPILNFMHYGLH